MLKRVFLFLAAVAIVAAGFAGYRMLAGNVAEPAAPEVTERAWPVRVATVHPAPLAPALTLFGRIESPRLAHLSAAVEADVVEVRAVEGALVEAGAAVVVLDAREAHLALRRREAEVKDIRAQLALEIERNRQDLELLDKERALLGLVRKDLDRATDLAARGVESRSRLDQVRERMARQELSVVARESAVRGHGSRRARLEARLVQAETARDRAALDVERTRIVSPFRGRVVEVFVAQGERVRSGGQVVSLFDVSKLEIRAQIPSRHLAGVEASKGRGGYFKLGARRYAVTLNRLGGRMAPGRGGIDALFTVDGTAGENLRIGHTVDLTLELPLQRRAVWLPFEALYGSDRVFKVRDGRLAGVEVRRIGEARGLQGRAGVLVASPDLASGDRVVVNQLANAVEGLRVEPSPDADG